METLILASTSPRRIELMRRIGLGNCVTAAPDVDESTVPPTPEAAEELARLKAENVARRSPPGALIIAADTLVVCGGAVLGKPNSEENAFCMLRTLAGRRHTVVTGVAVTRAGRLLLQSERTEVLMRTLTDAQILSYIATGEPMDKAGAYGIQERGALLVERIEGDFFNVMGLPLCLLSKMLAEFGIDVLR